MSFQKLKDKLTDLILEVNVKVFGGLFTCTNVNPI
jgi:hypothetical protein